MGVVHPAIHVDEAEPLDPLVARFCSADPVTQDSSDWQGYNRYSYVLNNPFMYTDPSGFSAWTKFRDRILKPFLIAAVGYLTGVWAANYWASSTVASYGLAGTSAATSTYISLQSTMTYGVIQGTVSGAVVGGIQSGSIEGALIGAVSGGLSGAIGAYYQDTQSLSRFVAQGAAGGVDAELRGGRFWDGFKASFVTSVASAGVSMIRRHQVQQSLKNAQGNASGYSVGLKGDYFKSGGQRQLEDAWGNLVPILEGDPGGPMGGWQGGRGRFLNIPYFSGDLLDYIVEMFAGPHDFLNSWYHYTANGNGRLLTGWQQWLGEALNYVNVIPAMPMVAVSVVPESTAHLFVDHGRGESNGR